MSNCCVKEMTVNDYLPLLCHLPLNKKKHFNDINISDKYIILTHHDNHCVINGFTFLFVASTSCRLLLPAGST